ncbi:MAG TPA: SMP-30/gluconolactonase/LRE family protein [Cytophagaceae bacterium]
MKQISSQLLVNSLNVLGEGPLWHRHRGTFMWVDIEAKKIFEFNLVSQYLKSWDIGHRVSLIVETQNADEVVLAVQGGTLLYNLSTSQATPLVDIEKNNEFNRTNDGSIDPLGRLWIGTMALDCKPGAGSLYCISKEGTPVQGIKETTISNGMVWTKDRKTLYYIDSATYTVKEYQFEIATGQITYLKDVIKVPESLGMPDGMCQDTDGMLWIGVWGGNGVYCYNPLNGQLIAKVDVPAPQITSCTFGGLNNDQLFITTARTGLSDEDLKKYPMSGGVFIANTGATGEARFWLI